MPTLNLDGNDYSSYATVEAADAYLAVDVGLFAAWAALDDSGKIRALISATRHMIGLTWRAGEAPDFADIPDVVSEVCIILAAHVAQDPTILDGAAGESNIKRAGAGSAQVEFFSPTRGRILPRRISSMLGNLIASGAGASGTGAATPFDASAGCDACPDALDAGLTGPLA